MKKNLILFLIMIVFISCTTSMNLKTEVLTEKKTNQDRTDIAEIMLLEKDEIALVNSVLIAKIRVRDSGLSYNCGYHDVLRQTKTKARDLGGNAIEVVEVYEPNILSTCYKMDVNVYYIDGYELLNKVEDEHITIEKNRLDYSYIYQNYPLNYNELNLQLSSLNSEYVNHNIRKSKNIGIASIPFSTVFGFTFAYSLINLPMRIVNDINQNWGMLAISGGSFLSMVLLGNWQNKINEKSVEYYNMYFDSEGNHE
ncbi:MAG: hypothetical protein PQJ59_19195 [Spirochaetales bacterium]|nr:hypothetical protein [Spirochaetales bacterium]